MDQKERQRLYRERRKAKGLPAIRGKSKPKEFPESLRELPSDVQRSYLLQVVRLLARLAEENKPWPGELERFRAFPAGKSAH